MPYQNELADKTSHIDIVKNPDVEEFLKKCHKIDYPEGENVKNLSSVFKMAPFSTSKKPKNIISIDGSYYESSVTEKFPSRKIGFIKVGVILLKYNVLDSIGSGSCFVDPFEVAKFKENNDSYSIILPSANIVYEECSDVKDSFRKALENQFDRLRTDSNNSESSLKTTLFKLSSYLEGCSDSEIKLSKCPSCGKEADIFVYKDKQSLCPHCHKPLYVTDILRVWEQVEGMNSSLSAITRTMNVVERLIAVHYIRTIVEKSRNSFVETLENICFFIDGPLAVFGEPAKLHSCIMKYLGHKNKEMRAHGKSDIMMIGIQKSGAINDFLNLIKDSIPSNTIYCLDDSFRYKYININRNPPSDTFGKETYFGQDFLYKSSTGKLFVFNVPYPWESKLSTSNFANEKSEIGNYPNIGTYCSILNDFECQMYENSLIPTVLAHKYTAISLAPGSKVLDLLAKSKIES